MYDTFVARSRYATVADLAGTPDPTDKLDGVSLRPFLENPSRLQFPAGDGTANKTLAFSQYPHSSESFGRTKGGLQSCVFFRDGQCHSNSTKNTRSGPGQEEIFSADPVPSNWMGFSVRSNRYRCKYTAICHYWWFIQLI